LVFGSSQFLSLSKDIQSWLKSLAIVAFIIQIGLWVNEGVTFWYTRYERQYAADDPSRLTTMRGARVVLRLILAVIVVLLVLDNIPGVEITALVASLGIGGIAVALALQNILGDLFASLSIVLDKPFVVGDFIIVDSFLGTVENIGLKTTRIRSLSGEQLVFSNNDLLKSRIRNYKRMQERRVLFSFGVVYQTTADKLESIPGVIRSIIEGQSDTRFDRAHFQGYGDFALNFEVVYYVLSSDYNVYMDIQQAINLKIYRRFQASGIEFAYPTRTLYMNTISNGAGAEAGNEG
jgi:small-conductance mechanosensitive channel